MSQTRRIKNKFSWAMERQSKPRFPGDSPPHKLEERFPLLWLSRIGRELFLVNSTGETISSVVVDKGQPAPQSNWPNDFGADSYQYKDIAPNEAIKVDEYDDYYDLDFLIQVRVKVTSPTFGITVLRAPLTKGGISSDTVLVWDTLEAGKHVLMERLPDH